METPSESGRPVDLRRLSETMYQSMCAIGGGLMWTEREGHTLSATALVGEAVSRLLASSCAQFNDRAHLMAAAATAMRRILVEHARARACIKRGGDRRRVVWDDVVHAVSTQEDASLLLSIDESLDVLAKEEARCAQIVEMRVFGALMNSEIASALGVSVGTVEKDWKYAKAKLLALLCR